MHLLQTVVLLGGWVKVKKIVSIFCCNLKHSPKPYLKDDTRVSIDIGPGVLHLAQLEENGRHNLVDLRHQLEHGVIGQVLERKLALHRVARISLAEDGVTVARHNLQRKR